MKIKNAEILCVGTEILIGDIVNTNAAFISQKLAVMGIDQYYQAAVGDNPVRLEKAINEALSRADLLIMSGGLGPTYDDLTKETAAKCMGRELVLNEEALERMQNRFSFMGRTMTENNKKQAYMPAGSVVFQNDAGTAPGCAIEDEERGKIIIMLPGPPFEMKQMFESSVMPYLGKYLSKHFVSKNINIFGMGESEVENRLRDMMENSVNPSIAPYCGDGEVRLRVTASAASEEECEELVDETIGQIMQSEVGQVVYGIDTTLEKALVEKLRSEKKSIAVAESCTGGLIAKRITDISGSSAVFGYGAVTYANEAKVKLLSVEPETLEKYGAVSEQTALQMANGVRALGGSDIGLATTGIAGPDGGTEEKPVGLVYVAVSTKDGCSVKRLMLKGDRERVRILASSNAIALALRALK